MRKIHKTQAEDFLNIQKKALKAAETALDRQNFSALGILAEECQEGAVCLGTMIETSEGTGYPFVLLLEEYCEFLYQFHESLTVEKSWEAKNNLWSMQKLLSRMQKFVAADTGEIMEVVFLPYKAAMWDSMESVWKEAVHDRNCHAYVVPIPYYDKNPDGTFQKMHYEIDQYPEDVPVISYEEYDISERRPEMIFIHNPYDECNYATSVHPFFYAGNLKQFTEKLIYIPYFILDEERITKKTPEEKWSHFVTLPGVLHADKVFVQSEKMRRTYINVMVSHAGSNTESYWENKIQGTGSPKIDKILQLKKDDVIIPPAWRKIMQGENGEEKKIILYNTSVAALLNYNERMIEKIKEVLAFFKERQNETALLWRPHPLMKTVMESMRPDLCAPYSEIVDTYRREGWGIYDDSSDFDRAVVLCDGYYGDRSSAIPLCRAGGVPLMIQEPQVKTGFSEEPVLKECESRRYREKHYGLKNFVESVAKKKENQQAYTQTAGARIWNMLVQ